MSQSEIKDTYDKLLKSGDLKEMFPKMKGIWEKDQNQFSKEYQKIELLLDNDDFDEESGFNEFEF